MSAKISVIVAAYNVEKYIERCILSLINQTYENLEIIVVNDGSKDRTGEILEKMALMDKRIKLIYEENAGLSCARNTGLKAATGEYIGYVDGDDYVSPYMYEYLKIGIEEHGADLSVCAYECVPEDSDNKDTCREPKADCFIDLPIKEALDVYICDDRDFHIYNSVWSKLFKKELVKDITFEPGKKSEDIMYTTEALLSASKVCFVDAPLYYYVVDRQDSLMNSNLAERRFNHELPFLRQQLESFERSVPGELSDKALYHYYRRLLFYYIDFRYRKMKEDAKKLAGIILNNSGEAEKSVSFSFVKKGDKLRTKLFLKSPGLYFAVVRIYEGLVLPIRNRNN